MSGTNAGGGGGAGDNKANNETNQKAKPTPQINSIVVYATNPVTAAPMTPAASGTVAPTPSDEDLKKAVEEEKKAFIQSIYYKLNEVKDLTELDGLKKQIGKNEQEQIYGVNIPKSMSYKDARIIFLNRIKVRKKALEKSAPKIEQAPQLTDELVAPDTPLTPEQVKFADHVKSILYWEEESKLYRNEDDLKELEKEFQVSGGVFNQNKPTNGQKKTLDKFGIAIPKGMGWQDAKKIILSCIQEMQKEREKSEIPQNEISQERITEAKNAVFPSIESKKTEPTLGDKGEEGDASKETEPTLGDKGEVGGTLRSSEKPDPIERLVVDQEVDSSLKSVLQSRIAHDYQQLKMKGKKSSGQQKGGVYKDNSRGENSYMIKADSSVKANEYLDLPCEYVYGQVYQTLLPGRVPEINLSVNKENGDVALSSKFIIGDTNQSTLTESNPAYNLDQYLTQNNGFATFETLKGEKVEIPYQEIKGAEDLFAASMLSSDLDIHDGNVGIKRVIVDDKVKYVVCKIDHGKAGANSGIKSFLKDMSECTEKYLDSFTIFRLPFNLDTFRANLEIKTDALIKQFDDIVDRRVDELASKGFDFEKMDLTILDPNIANIKNHSLSKKGLF
ncbi:MAG: hypothetical protein SFT91_03660, partial [Rickettsiaceae bacterium]|nr:hypothetical protein [Rickettsiaceae bacterium]